MTTTYGKIATSPAEMAANRARLAASIAVANSGGVGALKSFYGGNTTTPNIPPVPSPAPTPLYNPSTGVTATPNANVTPQQVNSAMSSGYSNAPQAIPAPNTNPNQYTQQTDPASSYTQQNNQSNPTVSPTSNETLSGLLSKYQQALLPTQKMKDISGNIANLEDARRTTDTNLGMEGINAGAKAGYSATIDRQALDKENALQNQYNIEQNTQQAGAKGLETALGLASTNLGMGQNNTNLITGNVNAEGQSYAAKQGSANVLSLSKTYPDAGILPSDSPDVAAQKASQAASFIAKYGKSQYQWNPSTGQFDLLTTSRLGTTTPGASYTGNPNGNGGGKSSGSTNFGVSSGGYKAGQLTSLLKSQGQTADDATLQGLWSKYGNGGAYANDTAHNAAIYSAMNGGGNASGGLASVPIGNNTAPKGISSLSSKEQIYAKTGDAKSAGLYPAEIGPASQKIAGVIPGWDPVNAVASAKFYSNPETQKFIANSHTVLNTLQQIKDISNKVDRSNITLLNDGQFAIARGTSDANTAKFIQLAGILSDEVGKLVGSGQGSDFTIKLGQSFINPAYSQDTFNGTIDQLSGRVQNKVDEYMKQGGQAGSSSGGSGGGTQGSTPSGINYTIH